MAVWFIRAGKDGIHEEKFLKDKKIYLTWDNLDTDLGTCKTKETLKNLLTGLYVNKGARTISSSAGQAWRFYQEIDVGDIILVPIKSTRMIQAGKIIGGYKFDRKESNPYYHSRSVEWYPNQFSRDTFPPDLIFSFGSLLTISNISRNNAESRILKIIDKKTSNISTNVLPADSESENESLDFEVMAGDEISRYIIQRFQGHGLTRLVEAILKAQGYTTYLSPEGSDGGVDIIAGYGHLGFGTPRLVVQVKSGDSPTDRPTVDNLMGVVQRFKANEGLFVSWSGFKKNVYREMASDFFTIRLWTQKEFLEALFQNYDKLDEDLKAEIPLKRIWALTQIEN